MSRIGKKPILIPTGVEVEVMGNRINIKGPKGFLNFECHQETKIEVKGNEILVSKIGKSKQSPAIWGTTAKIIANMITGVTVGFQKKLELNGVGYRMNIQNEKIILALGLSHLVEVVIPQELEVKIEQNTITINGIDKQRVGQFAAEIRALKPAEPYKGKGFRYVGEVIRRKEGKKASASS